MPSLAGVDLVHVVLDHIGQRVVGAVAGLTVLEEDIAVLVAAACMRMLGVQRVIAERLDGIHVAHLGEIGVIPHGNLLDLVGGAEAVEEVDERRATLDGREVCHGRKIHDLLDIALGEHGKAGLTAGHDVGVVTKDVERVARHGTSGHVDCDAV